MPLWPILEWIPETLAKWYLASTRKTALRTVHEVARLKVRNLGTVFNSLPNDEIYTDPASKHLQDNKLKMAQKAE